MKTKTLYIVGISERGCLRKQANKLRTFARARRLVRRLKSRGIDAHPWPVTVDQSAVGLS